MAKPQSSTVQSLTFKEGGEIKVRIEDSTFRCVLRNWGVNTIPKYFQFDRDASSRVRIGTDASLILEFSVLEEQ